MKKFGRVVAFVAVFLVGALLGTGFASYQWGKVVFGRAGETEAINLMADLAIAGQLRLGEAEGALERLEERIDRQIVFVAEPPPHVPKSAVVDRALRRAKTYRERYPSASQMAPEVATALQSVEAEPRDAHPGTLTRVGDEAPAFAVTTLDGTPLDLAALRGQVVVLNFLSPACGPCLQELPHLEREIWAKYKGRGVAMVAVSRDGTAAEARAIREGKGLTFAMATQGGEAAYRKYAKMGVPQTYIIDSAGKIAYQCTGFAAGDTEQMVEVIEQNLGQSGNATPAP